MHEFKFSKVYTKSKPLQLHYAWVHIFHVACNHLFKNLDIAKQIKKITFLDFPILLLQVHAVTIFIKFYYFHFELSYSVASLCYD